MSVPYVHSNYERIEDDNYQTVDPRCVQALVETASIIRGKIVDCCSPNGSGIVDKLRSLGFVADGMSDAFSLTEDVDWIVSNPPYKRGLVDKIIWRQIERLEFEHVFGVAMLLRSNFDFAKSRWGMFNNLWYFGQVRMMFRPWWSEDKKAQPIHNFVWHIWTASCMESQPSVWYWRENE